MLRTYQKVLWVVSLVALGAFSMAGFLANVELIPGMTVYIALGDMWAESMVRIAAGAVFLFLFALSIYLPVSTWLPGPGRVISLSNPLGPVELSTDAVSSFVQKAGQEMEGVEDVKIQVRAAQEGVESYITLSAYGEAEGGIPRLVNDFQELVKRCLTEKVGVSDVKRVEVKVTKIFQKGEKVG